jgi:4-amino-4-deoxy-L-arabinose transferase-like glycosyltransferase
MFICDKKHESWWYLILLLLMFFSFYFAIGTYPLFDNNEGLYASIARDMLSFKNFVIPHLNGVPYIEKPPLLYWLLVFSFSVLGVTAFAARLVTATSAALVCIAMVYFTKKIKQPSVGICGALIFSSSIGVCIIARMVYFDMLFTFLISGTLFCLFYWYESHKVYILRIGYLFLGLAILAKGLIAAVLIGGSFVAFLILENNYQKLYKILDLWGIVLFLTIVLPWHIAAIVQHKGYAWRYLIEEHFLRYLNQREPHDYYHGPIYYYLPRMLIYLFPWSFFIPLIFLQTKTDNTVEKKLLRFSWCWLMVPLIFFSLSSAKANYYMIVSTPALAIILGIKINYCIQKFDSNVFGIWTAIILFVIALTLGGILYFVPISVLQLDGIIRTILIITIAYCLIAGLAIVIVVRRQDIIATMLALFIVPAAIMIVSYVKVIQDQLSTAAAGQFLALEASHRSLYLYQDFENISAIAFYAPSHFKIIDSCSSDLYYGARLPEFKQQFVAKKDFLRKMQRSYIVVPAKKLAQFYNDMHPAKFSLLKKFSKVVIVKRRI